MNFNLRATLSIGLIKGSVAGKHEGKPVSHDYALNTIKGELAYIGIQGYTVRATHGYWNGNVEPALEVVVVTDEENRGVLTVAAKVIKEQLDQDAVLVVFESIKGELV